MTFIEPRIAVANYILQSHADIVPEIGTRLYPNTIVPDRDKVQAITVNDTPECFVEGVLLPTGLVISDGSIRFGPHELGTEIFFRVVFWQYDGRGIIDRVVDELGVAMQGERLPALSGSYTFQWAGNSPSSLDDPSLMNAPMAWVRFQMARVLR